MINLTTTIIQPWDSGSADLWRNPNVETKLQMAGMIASWNQMKALPKGMCQMNPNDTFSGGFKHGQIESHLGWWQRYLWRASTSLWPNCCSKVMLWSPWSQLLGSNVAVDVTMDMSISLFQSFQGLVGPRDVLVCCQVHTWARTCVPLCACSAGLPACENEKHRCKYMTEPLNLFHVLPFPPEMVIHYDIHGFIPNISQ